MIPRSLDGRTHYEGCWKTKGHHDCAEAEIDSLRARCEIAERGIAAMFARVDELRAQLVAAQRVPADAVRAELERESVERESVEREVVCRTCDGVGWCEGAKTRVLGEDCETCGGSGLEPADARAARGESK